MAERLLEIETDSMWVSLEGTVQPGRWGVVHHQSAPKSRMNVSVEGDTYLTWNWLDIEEIRHTDEPTFGPRLYEETDYKLTVGAADPVNPVELRHRDPTLIRTVTPVANHRSLISGVINFRQQVGMSRFQILCAGTKLDIEVEVFPAKLDYASDYGAILDSITVTSRALVLENLRSTYQLGRGNDEEQTALDWLILLRSEARNLETSLKYIAAHPHRTLALNLTVGPLERVHPGSSISRRAIVRGQGEGSWVSFPLVGRARAKIPASDRRESTNTQEHRWIRAQLLQIVNRLTHISNGLESGTKRSMGQVRSPRIAREIEEIQTMRSMLGNALIQEPLAHSKGAIDSGPASLTMMNSPGYRETYQSILRIRNSLALEGEAVELSLKDISVLYEYYCFITTVALVKKITGAEIYFEELYSVDESGIRIRLSKGSSSSVNFVGSERRLRLLYNPQYPGITGLQRPDIVIEVLNEGWPPIVVILDAKYRIDASVDYRKSFISPGPPIDAINQLHRYRDAITQEVDGYGFGRPTVSGAALFPLGGTAADVFVGEHRLASSLGKVGIGAIPLLPDTELFYENWLKQVLSTPIKILAEPGPQFLGLEHSRLYANFD